MTISEAIEKSEELFDKFSEHIDDDIDSLANVAGTVILTRRQYEKLIYEFADFLLSTHPKDTPIKG